MWEGLEWLLLVSSVGADPTDVVLAVLLDEIDALQHVGDVVDASLLHSKLVYRPVQVQRLVRGLLQQLDKSECQGHESVFFAAPLTQRDVAMFVTTVPVVVFQRELAIARVFSTGVLAAQGSRLVGSSGPCRLFVGEGQFLMLLLLAHLIIL